MEPAATTGGIRYGRVLAGGLVAGLICNVSGMALGLLVLHDEVAAAFDRLGIRLDPGRMFATHVSMRMAIGLCTVWLYAAIRPRFGPGPRTATIAALYVWLATDVLAATMLLDLGVYSPRATALALLWALAEAIAMSLAGAALYRERAPSPPPGR